MYSWREGLRKIQWDDDLCQIGFETVFFSKDEMLSLKGLNLWKTKDKYLYKVCAGLGLEQRQHDAIVDQRGWYTSCHFRYAQVEDETAEVAQVQRPWETF